jgi:tripartite-type tricarboxylate transporter receptor subunit TctC
VRIVVPFAAGGAVDLLARMVSPKLSDSFAQPVLVDNRPGAGGNIGAEMVAKAAPDGYTLLLAPVGQATLPALYRKLPYSPNDLAAVTQLVGTAFVTVVTPKLPAANLKEMLALAKSKAGGLNYGSTGIGTAPHLAMELVKLSAAVDITHVPYKGDAPLNAGLMAGEVETAIVPTSTALPFIKAGKIRPIGVTGARRLAAMPDVPTMVEAGLAGYEFTSWQGFFAPAKTPREVIARIHRDTAAALNSPDVRDRLASQGAEVVASTPDEFDAKYKAEVAKFARIVREAKIPQQD